MSKNSNKPAALVPNFTGKSAAARLEAFQSIPLATFNEGVSRKAVISHMALALGNAPSDGLVKLVQRQWMTGRVAFRLPSSELPAGCTTPEARLAFAYDLLTVYASAPKAGTEARPLRVGQVGRRTAGQQKVVNAATEGWSQIAAEVGGGKAMTQAERNAAKKREAERKVRAADAAAAKAAAGVGDAGGERAPHQNETQKADNVVNLPAPKVRTASDVVDHITTQLVALRAFADKHAKLVPMELGEAVQLIGEARSSAIMGKRNFEARNNAA